MNMISTGAFLNEMDASNKQPTVAEKFAAVWEKKNAKAARAGGVSLMALSLAACGSSSSTTTTSSTSTTTTTTTDSAKSLVFTKDVIDTLTGGSGDDTFKGDSNTVTAADSASGGAGDDTVTLVGTTTLPEVSSIETIELKSFTSAALDFTTNELTGVKNIILDTFTVAGDDLKLEAGQSVKIDDATGAAAAIEIKGDTWTTGTITVSDSGSATHSIDLDFNSAKTTSATIVEAGSDATSYVDIVNTGAKLKTLTVNSSYKLTMDDVAVATTIDASGSTGTLAVTSSVNKVAYTGGSGADTFTFGIADGTGKELTAKLGAGDDKLVISNINNSTDFTNSKSTMDGGDGEDTFSGDDALIAELGALTSANYAKIGITGFEKVELATAAANASSTSFANFGANYVVVATDNGDDHAFTGLTSGATIEFGTAVDAYGDIANTAAEELTVTLSDRAGSGDQLNVIVKNTTSGGHFDLKIPEIETLSVDASSSDQANQIKLEAANLTKLVLDTGTTDLTVDMTATNSSGGTLIAEVDATGATSTGGVVFVAAGSALAGITFKGSAGGDDFTGGAMSDVVITGAGDDKYDLAGGGANTVDLSGGGKDEIEINASHGKTTVTGFATGDVIDVQHSIGDDGEVTLNGVASAKYDHGDKVTIITSINASTTSMVTGGSQTIADFTDLTDVAAYLDEGITSASGEDAYFVLNDGTNSYVYSFEEAGTDTDIDGDDTLALAVVVENHILVAADVAQTN